MFGWSAEEALGRVIPPFVTEEQEQEYLENMRRPMEGEGVFGLEVRRYRKDGSPIDMSVWTAPLRDAQGDISGVVTIIVDITEHNIAQEAIRESEERYRTLFEDSRDAIFIRSLEGKIIEFNQAALDLFGIDREEAIGSNVADRYVDRADRQKFEQELVKFGSVRDFEAKLRKQDGTEMDCLSTSNLIRSADGAVIGYQGIIRDITEGKKSEQALRELQEAERELAEVTARLAEIGRIVTSNLDIDEVYDRFAEEVKKLVDFEGISVNVIDHETGTFVIRYVSGVIQPGRNAGDILPLEGTQTGEVVKTGKPLVRRDVGADARFTTDQNLLDMGLGSSIMVPLRYQDRIIGSLSLRGRGKGLYGSREQSIVERLADQIAPAVENAGLYSESQRIQDALRQAEQKYRDIFDNAVEGIFQNTPDGVYLAANPALARIYGYDSPDELMATANGPRRQLYVEPDQYDEVRRILEEDGAVSGFQTRFRKRNGRNIWVSISARAVRDDDGGIRYFGGIVEDITERVEAEEAEREAEHKYRSIFDESKDPIFVTSREGYVLDANQSALDLFGYDMDDFLELPLRDICVNVDDHTKMVQEVNREGSVKDYELHLLRKDGSVVEGLVSLAVKRDDQGKITGYQGMVRDTTEHNRIEEEAHQQTREVAVLEERNRMAREIHDIMAQGFTGIVLQLEAGEQAMAESPGQILEHLARARSLAREGLQEARRSVWGLLPHALEQMSLDAALQEEVRRFGVADGDKAAFSLSGKRRDLPAYVETVLLRICQESLTNVKRHASATEVNVNLQFKSDHVSLTIEDNGVGFEPTKAKSENGPLTFGSTGMEQRAKQLEGSLEVKSKKGEGTLVKVTIPTL